MPAHVSTPSEVVHIIAAFAAGAIATAVLTTRADVASAANTLRILVDFIIT